HPPIVPKDKLWHALSAFFFYSSATRDIYPLSLHDALPISLAPARSAPRTFASRSNIVSTTTRTCGRAAIAIAVPATPSVPGICTDRKSTRLNSSHVKISYAVFCLKKKKQTPHPSL